jgi:hypothetical protein
MTDRFPVPANGGAVTVTSTTGVVADHVGDVAGDRVQPAANSPRMVALTEELVRHIGLNSLQRDMARSWLAQHAPEFEQEREARAVEERLAQDEVDKAAGTQALRADWRGEYDRNIARIHTGFDSLNEDFVEEILRARDVDGTPICSKPAFVRALLEVVPQPGTGGGEGNATDRRLELEAMMGDRRSAYHRGPQSEALQAEYRELIDQGATAEGAGSSVVYPEARIQQLERMMRDRRSRYWKGPEAESLQGEYRELVDQRRR